MVIKRRKTSDSLCFKTPSRKSPWKSSPKTLQFSILPTNLKKPVLDVLVDDYSDFCHLKRLKHGEEDQEEEQENSCTTTVSTQLNLLDILSYAHRISYTTFTLPEFGVLPPAPQEEQMRASQLYSFADPDVGLPKRMETEEKTIQPFIETSGGQPAGPNQLAKLAGLLPPNILVQWYVPWVLIKVANLDLFNPLNKL